MLDLRQYESLGAALRDALERWPDEVCLIEADRERETCRFTYRQFKEAALPLAGALEEGGFAGGDRAAIIMTNQSKWLISAYAVFYVGGVLVPLDYKLNPQEHLQLLAHSKARVLIVEHHLWRAITQTEGFRYLRVGTVLVTEAPPGSDPVGARRWEEFRAKQEPAFVPRSRNDMACIVYSSGTGGRPKGCVMTHENYLEQCVALTALYPFWPGVRYLSILPTNHAIDFMAGFIGPFTCGAAVVHLRTLRPEYIREAFSRYKITYMSLVPLVLKNLEKGLRARLAELPPHKRTLFRGLVMLNRLFTRKRPNGTLSRRLLPQVHQAFGGELRALFVGGAFTEPATLQFFYDLGIPVANGYGLTEAGTAVTLNDFNPFRPDTVGKPLPGMEVRIANPDGDGIGEVTVRSKTVMSHYLDDPELTAETIVDGWLMTGDLGRLDGAGHLQLSGRKKNMIVTEEGKNIYPEDIEHFFEGLPVKDFCVFAANYLWPQRTMLGEQLIVVLHQEPGQQFTEALREDLASRNRRLLNYKRISGYVLWDEDFPRTASLKIRRSVLAEQIRQRLDRVKAVVAL
ncbi:MAG TPA: AMP-binding protein [Candidatus Acidoferrales bacterium]|nr:AMP-binding protein [Candidatus Acidoferrales bacterium]